MLCSNVTHVLILKCSVIRRADLHTTLLLNLLKGSEKTGPTTGNQQLALKCYVGSALGPMAWPVFSELREAGAEKKNTGAQTW